MTTNLKKKKEKEKYSDSCVIRIRISKKNATKRNAEFNGVCDRRPQWESHNLYLAITKWNITICLLRLFLSFSLSLYLCSLLYCVCALSTELHNVPCVHPVERESFVDTWQCIYEPRVPIQILLKSDTAPFLKWGASFFFFWLTITIGELAECLNYKFLMSNVKTKKG